ncbi:hypothetical protein S101258_00146 [Lactiplantibacillus plantarum subsp. plantarum]|uniref:Uncharacterized protein n=1 Tax=Lactiplantibacillus plantarum subsp. plantarum TaxID=337330 RepID=A0A2S3U9T1_LACPN|nr:hypothetical protein S101258_00146 [Lactiplantibacillus plantarum subsp. plantarum]
MIGQPIVIYTAQRALLTTIPSRYGLLGAIAYTSDPHHYLAMLESALIPALLIALKPLNRYAAPYTWSTILKKDARLVAIWNELVLFLNQPVCSKLAG